MASAGLKTEDASGCFASVLLEFRVFFVIWADFTRFQRFGRSEWIRIDLGIFEFGLVNFIGVV